MRKLVALLFALVALAWTCATPCAGFFATGITSTGNCPKGTAFADGCAAAPAAQFIRPSFFSTAPQSSQSYVTRPPWNVAGVDYAVGTTTPVASLTDVALASIPGCVFQSLYSSYAPALVCTSTASPTISGYDFGPNQAFKTGSGPVTAHDCVILVINNSVTGTVTIKNNRFEFGWTGATSPSSCAGGATTWTGSYPLGINYPNSTVGGLNPIIWFANSSQADADIENNEFDGNYKSTCCQTAVVGHGGIEPINYISSGTHTVKVMYNVFKEVSAGAFVATGGASPLNTYMFKNNYVEGWIKRSPPAHGEVISLAGAYDTFTGSYNTIFTTTDMCFCNTGVFWLESSGQSTINSATMDHNTIATNNPGGVANNVQGTISGTVSDGAGGPGNILTVSSLSGAGPNIGSSITAGTVGLQIFDHVNGSPVSGVGSQWHVDCANGAAPATTNPCPNIAGTNVTYTGPNGSTPGVMYGTGYGLSVALSNVTVKGGYANDAAAQLAHGVFGALFYNSNYIDPTGGYNGAVWTVQAPATCGTPATFTGNINLLTGNSTNVNAWTGGSGATGC